MAVFPFGDVNGRMFYACMAVLYKPRNSQAGTEAPEDGIFLTGVQSVGVNSDFPSASLMDVGRAKRKYHYYAPQSFEITIERVVDQSGDFFYRVDNSGYTANDDGAKQCHILHAGNIGTTGRLDSAGKCLKNYDITILYGKDDNESVSESGKTATACGISGSGSVFQVTYRNCLITSISYSITDSGPVTESITLISRGATYNENTDPDDYDLPGVTYNSSGGICTRTDQSGVVIKRQHLDFLHEGSSWGTKYSLLPEEVETMFLAKDGAGNSPLEPTNNEAMRLLGINSISIDIAIEYSELADIGKWRGSIDQGKQNLWRYVTLPVQVSSSFSGTLRQPFPKTADQFEAGTYMRNTDTTFSSANGLVSAKDWNRVNRQIRLVAKMWTKPTPNYFVWDLGSRNYLTDFSYDGGGTDGGNLEATMSYQNDSSDIVLVKDTTVRNLPDVLF